MFLFYLKYIDTSFFSFTLKYMHRILPFHLESLSPKLFYSILNILMQYITVLSGVSSCQSLLCSLGIVGIKYFYSTEKCRHKLLLFYLKWVDVNYFSSICKIWSAISSHTSWIFRHKNTSVPSWKCSRKHLCLIWKISTPNTAHPSWKCRHKILLSHLECLAYKYLFPMECVGVKYIYYIREV